MVRGGISVGLTGVAAGMVALAGAVLAAPLAGPVPTRAAGIATWSASNVQPTGVCAEEGCFETFTFGPAKFTGGLQYDGRDYVAQLATETAAAEWADGAVTRISSFAIWGKVFRAATGATVHHLTGRCASDDATRDSTTLSSVNDVTATITGEGVDASFGLDCTVSVDGGPTVALFLALDDMSTTNSTSDQSFQTDYEQRLY